MNTTAPTWSLIWSDEFDGPAGTRPDAAKWQYDLGGQGWGNQEWEYYTDAPENAALDGKGALIINALEAPDAEAGGLKCWYGPCRFTSARIRTESRFEFAYGRVEARLKIPFGQGIWPAFWMLGANLASDGWPDCGEIDIMENIGREPSTIYGSVHGPGYSGGNSITAAYSLPSGQAIKDDYHIFVVEWEPDALRWYVDGTLYNTIKKDVIPQGKSWVFDHPFFIILNVAVGGIWPGYPDETSTYPQKMWVDYVRVYQHP